MMTQNDPNGTRKEGRLGLLSGYCHERIGRSVTSGLLGLGAKIGVVVLLYVSIDTIGGAHFRNQDKAVVAQVRTTAQARANRG